MQPCRERRVSPETADLAIKLYKDILGQVFRLKRILKHAKTDRVNPAVMPLIDLFERHHIALGSRLSQLKIADRASLGRRFSDASALGLFRSFSCLQHRII